MITVGCARNEVASDYIIQTLGDDFEYIGDPASAEIVIVNTCGFIESAKQESISLILEVAGLDRPEPSILAIVGCLAQRYADELAEEIPEADIIIGIENFGQYAQAIKMAINGHRHITAPELSDFQSRPKRAHSSQKISAYLQIADGCNVRCSFCAIPHIRGRYQSRQPDVVVKEAQMLLDMGVRELNLVAQDISGYGLDLDSGVTLASLLEHLDRLAGGFWIRLLYLQPQGIDNALINTIADSRHICRYLDMPIQHSSPAILARMGRQKGEMASGDDYLKLLDRLRQDIPGVFIRSTFMVGFPGETEDDFAGLCRFIDQAQLDYAGFFVYSSEEGTKAAKLAGIVDKETATIRAAQAEALQAQISIDRISRLTGQEVTVLVEKYDETDSVFMGRSEFQAPEVDGEARIIEQGGREIKPGLFLRGKVQETEDFDIFVRSF